MTFSILINPFFILCLITGIASLISGWFFQKYPPKKINHWYGYRTPSSKRNQETWDFAQKYSANEMIKVGLLFIVISIFGLFVSEDPMIGVFAGITVMIILFGILIYRVESAIKKIK